MSDKNNPDHSLPYHVRGAFRGFETALARYLATVGLPLAHFHILRLQWDGSGSTQKYIAKKSFMTESVASQVIQQMEKDGVLKRKLDPTDKRKRRVFLTAKGKKLREKVVTHGMKISQAHSPDISAQDMKTTIEVLIKVRQAFEAFNKI